MKKNPKDPKILSKKKSQCNDAQNQMKKTKTKTKTKRNSPSPTLGGTIDNFGKDIQMTKGQEASTSDP